MQAYTTNYPNSSDSSRLEVKQNRSWNPELARPYISPESAKLKTTGESIDWMRQAAVISGHYDTKRVDELVPVSNKSVVGSINQAIFGGEQTGNSAYDKTVQLLCAEAKLGGEFFGGDNSVATHQFFSFTPDKWIYFEHKIVGLFKSQDTMINYDIVGGNVRKSINGNISSMTEYETGNLMDVLQYYAAYIGTNIYQEHYKTLTEWQNRQAATFGRAGVANITNVAKSAHEEQIALQKQRQSYLDARSRDLMEPGDFALAT